MSSLGEKNPLRNVGSANLLRPLSQDEDPPPLTPRYHQLCFPLHRGLKKLGKIKFELPIPSRKPLCSMAFLFNNIEA
jgi:hypothetical protein